MLGTPSGRGTHKCSTDARASLGCSTKSRTSLDKVSILLDTAERLPSTPEHCRATPEQLPSKSRANVEQLPEQKLIGISSRHNEPDTLEFTHRDKPFSRSVSHALQETRARELTLTETRARELHTIRKINTDLLNFTQFLRKFDIFQVNQSVFRAKIREFPRLLRDFYETFEQKSTMKLH